MLVAERKPPIIILATFTPLGTTHSVALIFLHGLGDDGAGLKGLCYPMYLSSLIFILQVSHISPDNHIENVQAS